MPLVTLWAVFHDVEGLDTGFPLTFLPFCVVSVQVVAVFVVMGVQYPLSLSGVPVILVIGICLYFFFKPANLVAQRCIRAIEAGILGKVFQSLNGMDVIRVLEQKELFWAEMDAYIRLDATVRYVVASFRRWFTLDLQLLVAVFVFFSSAITIAFKGQGSFGGLFLVYVFKLSSALQETLTILLNESRQAKRRPERARSRRRHRKRRLPQRERLQRAEEDDGDCRKACEDQDQVAKNESVN
jgi:ABC-type transport system involved in cytochrome bd biosynthesis fused ATPase/permease subunit